MMVGQKRAAVGQEPSAIAFRSASALTLGLPMSPQDAWVAATALRYNLPLVTHDPDDFQQIAGLIVITEHERGSLSS